jgi:DNA topoisomerase-1
MEKNKRWSSAGRVQSVSVRLVVERERDIQNFNASASYSVVAELLTKLESHLKQNCLKFQY